jgi:transcriptional regulator with XRE-family HTH domain
MTPADEVVRLSRLLRGKIAEHRLTLREVSERLGFHTEYLSATLSGRRPLKLKVVFGALAAIKLQPSQFFGEAYRLVPWLPHSPGPARAKLATADPAAAGEPTLAHLVAAALEAERRRPIDQEEELGRLTRLLRQRIRDAGSNARSVSRAIGLAPGHLGQILNGYVDFQALHLYQALAALEISPADFFTDLYPVPGFERGAEPPGQPAWSRVLALARALVAELERAGGEGDPGRRAGAETRVRRR